MNKENVQKWVDALRSGEYAQERNYLATTEGFCCLGVACEISGVVGKKQITPALEGVYEYDGAVAWLPSVVQDWLGVTTGAPLVDVPGKGERSLIQLNDDDGLDFNEIADLIHKHAGL